MYAYPLKRLQRQSVVRVPRGTMASAEPKRLESKAWSCASLERGVNRVNSFYSHFKNDELTEEDMLQELSVPRICLVNSTISFSRPN